MEKAVTSFVDAVNIAISTGNVEPYERRITEECSCSALADSAREKFAGAAKSTGASWSLQGVRVQRISSVRADVTVTYQATAYRNINANGQVYEEFPATRSSAAVHLRRTANAWLVDDFDVLSRESV